MNTQAVRVVMYEEIVRLLHEWGVGGRACEFGTTSNHVIRDQIPFSEFKLLPYPEYDICNLHNLDSQWDFMLADQVLDHVRNPWVAVEEVRKHLCPGGVAVFTTPFLYHAHPSPNDYWRFTSEGMRVLCASFAEVITGQWSDQHSVAAPFKYDPKTTGLNDRTNDLSLPMVVWTVARAAGAKRVEPGWRPPVVEEASKGGPWQIVDYQVTGGDNWVEKLVCDYMVSTYHPQTALDLGCGAGLFVQYLNYKGVDARGVEAADLREIQPLPDRFIQQDLRVPFDLEKRFDLVLCLEVAEHIDAAFEEILFENIRRHVGKYLLFSAATPGQEGHGHVNEHTAEYWSTILRELGFRLLVDQTNICRALCKYPWYAKNISLWEIDPSRDASQSNELVPTQLIERPDTYVLNLEELNRYQERRIDEIEHSRAWLEEQRANWLAEAERWAAQSAEQQAWIAELERGKAILEQQRANWQHLAEEREQQLQARQAAWVAELVETREWVEEQRANWQAERERWAAQSAEQQAWIAQLEHAKDQLEEQLHMQQTPQLHPTAQEQLSPSQLLIEQAPAAQSSDLGNLDAIMVRIRQKLRSKRQRAVSSNEIDSHQL